MDLLRSVCPVINQFLCTPALWKHTALAMMSFTPTIRLPVHTVAMVQRQGIFAVESIVSELAEQLGMDATEIRDKNMIREGMVMPAYYNEIANACALDRCMEHCRKMFNWEERSKVRDMGNGKVRTAGVAMAMQGSCISNVDVGSATVKLSEDGTYNLIIGAADMGTGCDTILAQMVAELMDCWWMMLLSSVPHRCFSL